MNFRPEGPGGSYIAYWEILTPIYSPNSKVTITDRFQGGNGYLPHSVETYHYKDYEGSFVDSGLFLEFGYYTPLPGGEQYDESPANPDSHAQVAHFGPTGNVISSGPSFDQERPVLSVDSDKKGFVLEFDAQPNRIYRLRFYTAPDGPYLNDDQLYNSALVNGVDVADVNTMRGASGWSRVDNVGIAVKKAVDGKSADAVPVGDTQFTVEYEVTLVDSTKKTERKVVPYDYLFHPLALYPNGASFKIKEVNLPKIEGVEWDAYTLTGEGVTDNKDGTFTVTPENGTTAELVLTNHTKNPPEPSVVIVKKDEAGMCLAVLG